MTTEETTVRNKQVVLRDYLISGSPKESDIKVVEASMELKVAEGSNQILLKNLYLSCDPDFRHLMTKEGLSGFHFTPGSPVFGYGVAKVVESQHADYMKGDFVWSNIMWEEYSLVSPAGQFLFKIDYSNVVPLSYYAGILGMHGMVVYVGLFEAGRPKKEDFVLVSAASGAIGHIAGQLAKLCGCYVVGTAGSQEKETQKKKEQRARESKRKKRGEREGVRLGSWRLYDRCELGYTIGEGTSGGRGNEQS
ncbi:NADPH-dependent oxidoreductase 2-alkenal reductase-like [Prosopis cineraria]|uniref:NADPH-dependent oxidoreductase 2-alkenal reductase-like n=1 Tax=Prosopis cineraria TaxID=364024 RepID=UPI0024109C45|nr:NADPH-dependent oxidoreductase 2-alkenal reductase-like [Prosopis cineraria]